MTLTVGAPFAHSPWGRVLAVAFGLIAAIGLGAVIALAGLGQLSADLDWGAAPGWFWRHRRHPEIQLWAAIGVSVAALALGALFMLTLWPRRPLHGAAHWGGAADLRRAGLFAETGVVIGRAHGRYLVSDAQSHVLTYAPTRAGKGVGLVIPTLLAWPGSAVVLDIKRENWAATAGYRRACGQTVHLFDPLAVDGRTSRFNPLGHVDRRDPIQALDELQRIGLMLFPGHDHADPFWSEAARTGFLGVGLMAAADPQRPFTLGEILRLLTQDDPRVRLPAIIRDGEDRGLTYHAVCIAAVNDFCAASENTFASIRQTITARMGLWLHPGVDAATAASDFDLADVGRGGLSIYLGATPDNMQRLAPLYALFFQQLIDRNTRTLPDRRTPRTLVLLDEFARLGPAPVLAKAFAYAAGYQLRLMAVIQSPSQLRGLYGADLAEEIMTNCGLEVVFAPRALVVAQALSERLGAQTVTARARSRPSGLTAGRRSLTLTDQRRPLLLPQELLNLPKDQLVILADGHPPLRGRRLTYYRDRRFKARAALLPPQPPSCTSSTGHPAEPATPIASERISQWIRQSLAAERDRSERNHST